MRDNVFNILSIDGGGIRGIYAATVILKMHQDLGIICFEEFDLIAGTSTGSIIAAALAIGIPPQEIVNLYVEKSKDIFKKNRVGGIITPKYNNENLKNVLYEVFEGSVFNDAKTRLMITATNVSDGMPWVFKSFYNERLTRDQNVKLADAVLASCCAPIYFNPYELNNQLLADGGLWANNPALAALVEALGRNIDTQKYKVRLLSIGTGVNIKHYPLDWVDKRWGITRWGVGLIDIILNMQSFSVEKYLNTIMNLEQYLRINFELGDNLSIDDLEVMHSLIEQASKDFYSNQTKIEKLLGKRTS